MWVVGCRLEDVLALVQLTPESCGAGAVNRAQKRPVFGQARSGGQLKTGLGVCVGLDCY